MKWLRRYKAMKKSMKKKLAGKKKRRVFRMKVFLNISRNLHKIFRGLCLDPLSHAEHQSVFISKQACLLMTTDWWERPRETVLLQKRSAKFFVLVFAIFLVLFMYVSCYTGWIEEFPEEHRQNQINLVDNMEQGQEKL